MATLTEKEIREKIFKYYTKKTDEYVEIYLVDNLYDLGYALIHEHGFFNGFPNRRLLESYFDYEAYARDQVMSHDFYLDFENGFAVETY